MTNVLAQKVPPESLEKNAESSRTLLVPVCFCFSPSQLIAPPNKKGVLETSCLVFATLFRFQFENFGFDGVLRTEENFFTLTECPGIIVVPAWKTERAKFLHSFAITCPTERQKIHKASHSGST